MTNILTVKIYHSKLSPIFQQAEREKFCNVFNNTKVSPIGSYSCLRYSLIKKYVTFIVSQ